MGRSKYTKDEKISICKRYQNGESPVLLALEVGVSPNRISIWNNKYISLGDSAFNETFGNTTYSKEFKLVIIQEYLAGKGSLAYLANKYHISSDEALRRWILKYNRHEKIKDYNPNRSVYKMKSRKLNYEEKLEIVKYCIANNLNYRKGAAKYNISYSQIYNWVKKYKLEGKNGLKDNRGHKKPLSALTDEEKLKREVELLKSRNEYLEMENEVLKKAEELERRLISQEAKR